MSERPQDIPVDKLRAHPRNPRLAPRADVVEQIAAQLRATGAFDPAHALIVRPLPDGAFEIISGHHRRDAAVAAGLAAVPAWVREMSDEDAYMALALENAQGELAPLEEGFHALGSGLTMKAYAARLGKPVTTLDHRWQAAKVASIVDPDIGIAGHWSALAEIHAAAEWLWPALVAAMLAGDWTVEQTRRRVAAIRCNEPPDWANIDTIATQLIEGNITPGQVKQFATVVEKSRATITGNAEDADRFTEQLLVALIEAHPWQLSQVITITQDVEEEQAALIRERKQADLLKTKRDEEIAARLARLRSNVSLDEWKELEDDERAALLTEPPEVAKNFNKQEGDSIEWAQWSWNPVTGCLHDCPYCYARDIALGPQMQKAGLYPHGFAPTLRPATLFAARHASVPKTAAKDARYRNVFVCSMADLFGRWVPREWVEAVLGEMRAAAHWNFLCLTKFPKRMAEFDIPPNVWMGTTVDLQARVPNAEAAFATVKAKVRWLSVEPMLQPLRFKHLDRFEWIVIGGASASTQTPAFVPPFAWVDDLVAQAREAGCRVYMKTNLGIANRILELPGGLPVEHDMLQEAPPALRYLGKFSEVEPPK